MKNRIVFYIIYFMIIVIIATFFVLLKYYPVGLEKKVLDINWYYYDSKTGYYNKLYINDGYLNYYKADNTSVQNIYDNCSKYTYKKKKKEFTLNCGEKLLINSYNNDKLSLLINNKEFLFFKNPFDSLNYEFEKYYNQSISEYKIQRMQGIDFIKINYDRMMELLDINENQTFLIYGDNCSSVECALLLDVVEKWISTNENIYYVNISKFDNKQMTKLNKKNDKFLLDSSYYNDVYPRIVVTKKNKILDDYLFKCKGFNCSKYIRN